MTLKQIGGKPNEVQWKLSNLKNTGRNILCRNRQGVRLQSAKNPIENGQFGMEINVG